jgi:tRNA G18 (ribose-2'-O)-methylase SpoU
MRKLETRELGRLSPGQFQETDKHRVVVVLDNVRSGLNVGAAFRSADAFAIESVYLCGITARPPHREILKTALGATETVSWRHWDDAASAVQALQSDGYTVWPVEQTDQSVLLNAVEWDPSTPLAFVFGNEVSGISEPVLALCSKSVEIPQFGTKHSLNISVSIGIVLWHVLYARGPLTR